MRTHKLRNADELDGRRLLGGVQFVEDGDVGRIERVPRQHRRQRLAGPRMRRRSVQAHDDGRDVVPPVMHLFYNGFEKAFHGNDSTDQLLYCSCPTLCSVIHINY